MAIEGRRVIGFVRDENVSLREREDLGPYLRESALALHARQFPPGDGVAYYPWQLFEDRNAHLFELGMKRIKRWSGPLRPADGFIDDNLSHTTRMLRHAETVIERLPSELVLPHSLRMTIASHDSGEIIAGDLPTEPYDEAIHRAHKAREVAAALQLARRIPNPAVKDATIALYLNYVQRRENPTVAARLAKYIDLVDAHLVLVEHGALITATGRIMDNPRTDLYRNLSLDNLRDHQRKILQLIDPRHHAVTQVVLEDLLKL